MALLQISSWQAVQFQVNYDYTRLNVESRALVGGGQGDNADSGDNNRPSSSSSSSTVVNSSLTKFLGWWAISEYSTKTDCTCS